MSTPAAGLPLAGGRPLYGEWTEEWGRRGADLLLRSAPGLDAIFCGNDQIARGVADRLREAGRRVPGDVALVGFDNWDVIATACRPPLTTVDMNLRRLGGPRGSACWPRWTAAGLASPPDAVPPGDPRLQSSRRRSAVGFRSIREVIGEAENPKYGLPEAVGLPSSGPPS